METGNSENSFRLVVTKEVEKYLEKTTWLEGGFFGSAFVLFEMEENCPNAMGTEHAETGEHGAGPWGDSCREHRMQER